MQVWNNPACSKCATARATLDEAGVAYQVRAYLDEPPTEDELRDVLRRLDAQPWDICRTGEPAAVASGIADWPRDAAHADRWVAALVRHPELIQRPILLLDDGGAVVARSPQVLSAVLRRRSPTRRQISDAVGAAGWRFVCGTLCTTVRVDSLGESVDLAARAVATCDGGDHLRLDVRADRLVLTLQTPAVADVTPADVDLAGRIAAAVRAAGREPEPGAARSVQVLEIAVDALDIAAVRPFWKAVLGYRDETATSGPTDPLVDPLGQGPPVWFQEMAAPRPQRNRIHVDVSVPHDEADARIRAALAAGGTVVTDAHAPSFWVLADPEGNEACVSTWQGRDG